MFGVFCVAATEGSKLLKSPQESTNSYPRKAFTLNPKSSKREKVKNQSTHILL
jgi:hypothetical protein